MATEGDAGANKGMDVSEVMRLFMEDRRQREAEVQAQLELFRNLVEETQGSRRTEIPAVATLSRKDLRLPKLTEEDDIESYLTTFEWMTAGYEIMQTGEMGIQTCATTNQSGKTGICSYGPGASIGLRFFSRNVV